MRKNLNDLPYGAEFKPRLGAKYRKVKVVEQRAPKGCWGELLDGSNIIAYFGENYGEVEWLNPPKFHVTDIPIGGQFKLGGHIYTRYKNPGWPRNAPPDCEACVRDNTTVTWLHHDHEVEPL